MHVMKFYLVRHGQTDYNVKHIVQGWSDVPLNSVGKEQAVQVALMMCDYHVDAVFASDLLRAKQTAEPIAAKLGLPVTYSWLLRERYFGALEGTDSDQIDWDKVNANGLEIQAQGVESRAHLDDRIRQFVSDLQLWPNPPHSIVVITHGGTMNHFCSCFLPKHEFCHFNNTQIVELTLED